MAYHDSNPLLLETLSIIGGVTASYNHLYTVLLHLLKGEEGTAGGGEGVGGERREMIGE